MRTITQSKQIYQVSLPLLKFVLRLSGTKGVGTCVAHGTLTYGCGSASLTAQTTLRHREYDTE